MTGFDAAPDDLRRRADQIDHVEDAVRRAIDAAIVASSPAAFGVLCGFFPGLLTPAQSSGRDALDHGSTAVRALGDAVRASARDYTRNDSDVAAGLRPNPEHR